MIAGKARQSSGTVNCATDKDSRLATPTSLPDNRRTQPGARGRPGDPSDGSKRDIGGPGDAGNTSWKVSMAPISGKFPGSDGEKAKKSEKEVADRRSCGIWGGRTKQRDQQESSEPIVTDNDHNRYFCPPETFVLCSIVHFNFRKEPQMVQSRWQSGSRGNSAAEKSSDWRKVCGENRKREEKTDLCAARREGARSGS